ncbi:MAG: hypothetical protein Q9162_003324 [Coniocarpon cinnabarinum]
MTSVGDVAPIRPPTPPKRQAGDDGIYEALRYLDTSDDLIAGKSLATPPPSSPHTTTSKAESSPASKKIRFETNTTCIDDALLSREKQCPHYRCEQDSARKNEKRIALTKSILKPVDLNTTLLPRGKYSTSTNDGGADINPPGERTVQSPPRLASLPEMLEYAVAQLAGGTPMTKRDGYRALFGSLKNCNENQARSLYLQKLPLLEDFVKRDMRNSDNTGEPASTVTINLAQRAASSLGSQKAASATVIEFLDLPNDSRGHNFDLLESWFLRMLKADKEDALEVPRVWSSIIMFLRGPGSCLQDWKYLDRYLRIIQRCFNTSNERVHVKAFVAWNHFTAALHRDGFMKESLLKILCQPTFRYLQRHRTSQEIARGRDAALYSFHFLLFLSFGPNAKPGHWVLAWKTFVHQAITQVAPSDPFLAAELGRIFRALFSTDFRIWNTSLIRLQSAQPVKLINLPRLTATWIRDNLSDTILPSMSALIPWTSERRSIEHLECQAQSVRVLFEELLRCLLEATSKEINPSLETMAATIGIMSFMLKNTIVLSDSRPQFNEIHLGLLLGCFLSMVEKLVQLLGPKRLTMTLGNTSVHMSDIDSSIPVLVLLLENLVDVEANVDQRIADRQSDAAGALYQILRNESSFSQWLSEKCRLRFEKFGPVVSNQGPDLLVTNPVTTSGALRPRPTPRRPRHDDSQVDFVAIECTSDAGNRPDSQMLTEHQHEVRQRQLDQAKSYPDFRSSPPAEALNDGAFRNADLVIIDESRMDANQAEKENLSSCVFDTAHVNPSDTLNTSPQPHQHPDVNNSTIERIPYDSAHSVQPPLNKVDLPHSSSHLNAIAQCGSALESKLIHRHPSNSKFDDNPSIPDQLCQNKDFASSSTSNNCNTDVAAGEARTRSTSDPSPLPTDSTEHDERAHHIEHHQVDGGVSQVDDSFIEAVVPLEHPSSASNHSDPEHGSEEKVSVKDRKLDVIREASKSPPGTKTVVQIDVPQTSSPGNSNMVNSDLQVANAAIKPPARIRRMTWKRRASLQTAQPSAAKRLRVPDSVAKVSSPQPPSGSTPKDSDSELETDEYIVLGKPTQNSPSTTANRSKRAKKVSIQRRSTRSKTPVQASTPSANTRRSSRRSSLVQSAASIPAQPSSRKRGASIVQGTEDNSARRKKRKNQEEAAVSPISQSGRVTRSISRANALSPETERPAAKRSAHLQKSKRQSKPHKAKTPEKQHDDSPASSQSTGNDASQGPHFTFTPPAPETPSAIRSSQRDEQLSPSSTARLAHTVTMTLRDLFKDVKRLFMGGAAVEQQRQELEDAYDALGRQVRAAGRRA